MPYTLSQKYKAFSDLYLIIFDTALKFPIQVDRRLHYYYHNGCHLPLLPDESYLQTALYKCNHYLDFLPCIMMI